MSNFFKIITVCYLLFFSFAGNANVIKSGDYEITIGPASTWIVSQSLDAPSVVVDKSPVKYRFIGRQERFTDNENAFYQDFAATALNQEGIKELSKLEFTFNPAFESLTLHKVEVERKGKWTDRLASSRINVINQEQELVNDLFSGLATAVVVVNDVRVGDTVRYQYSLTGRNPVYGREFGGRYPMGWDVPVDKLHLRLVNSTSRQMQFDPQSAKPSKTLKTALGTEYTWAQASVPKFTYESGAPAGYVWAPVVGVSSSPNWQQVVAWAKPHYEFNEADNEEIKSYINSVKAEFSSVEDQVSEIIRFVQQDVRYFGVELGQNSHIPHSPNVVFNRRYGDCKDKATLMVRLLADVGVKSYPALVNSQIGHVLSTRVPSAMSFDHVINWIEYNGLQYWVDGTNHSQAIGLNVLSTPDFGYALVLNDDTKALVAMPSGTPSADKVVVEQHYVSANYAQPTDMYITTRYSGKEADYMRYRLAGTSLTEVEQHYLNYYARLYSQIELASPLYMLDNFQHQNELIMTEHYRIGDFWTLENQAYQFSVHSSYLQDYVSLPQVISRKQPLAIAGPVRVEHHIRVSLPEDINYQVNDTPTRFSTPSLQYESSETYVNGEFYRDHTLVLQQREVGVSETRDYINVLRKIDDDLYYTGLVKGDFSVPVNPGVALLDSERHVDTSSKGAAVGGTHYE